MPAFHTYPARPIDGGRFELARPKIGEWYVEPKLNGWRALVHAPTGACWNRHGQPLSIAVEFAEALARLAESPFEWLDCEALERRHQIGRGTLIVLDLVDATLPYEQRARLIRERFPALLDTPFAKVHTTPFYPASFGPELYTLLKAENARLGAEFYEGLVMKKAGSLYPVQLHSPDRTTHTWVKHRWKF